MKSIGRFALIMTVGLTMSACQGKKDQTEPSAGTQQQARPAPMAPQAGQAARPRPVEVRPAARTRPAGPKSAWTMNFDQGKAGSLPAGIEGRTGKWALAADDRAKSGKQVVAQLASSGDSSFNVLLVTGGKYKNVRLSVWLRAMEGKVDQGGGLVWRAKDEKNYYVARYNPLEDNFRLYYVKDGHRKMLAGTALRVDHKAWHHMVVTMVGDHITVSLDGKKWLDFHDKTFTEAGMVGLWTKADARTHFDDFQVAFMAGAEKAAAPAAPARGAEAARKAAASRKAEVARKPAAR